MTTRWKLTIEYDGSNYSGWQIQDNVPTIQQSIEQAIEKFSGQQVRLHGAGRTDAGVHAFGQVAHVDMEDFTAPMEGYEVAKAIKAFLRPQPISIVKAEVVDDEFHARFGSKKKLYMYRIIARRSPPALERKRVWHIKRPMDAASMHKAAQYLLGTHDFTSYRDSGCQAKSPIRTLDSASVTARPYGSLQEGKEAGQEIICEFEAQSFLHHQVRNFVGTLALVGEGKWQPQEVQAALEAKDRTKAGPTAPSDGLYMVRIDYK